MKTSRVALMLCISIIIVGAVFVRAPAPNPSVLLPLASPSPSPAPCDGPFFTGRFVPVQVNYPKGQFDVSSEIDLDVTGFVTKVKSTLLYTQKKPTELTGDQPTNYISTLTITAGPQALSGKIKVKVQNGDPAEYESKHVIVVPACTSKVINLNGLGAKGQVTGILTGKKGDVHFAPEKTFEFTQSGENFEITMEYAGFQIAKTVVEKVIATVPINIRWQPLGFKDDERDLRELKRTAEDRAKSDSLEVLFFKANYPVENGKVRTSASQLPTVFTLPSSFAAWKAMPVNDQIRALIGQATTAGLQLHLSGYDRMIFVVPNGMLGPSRKGQANTAGDKAVYVVDVAGAVAETHEIGHTNPWRLDDDYKVFQGVLIQDGFESTGFLSTLAAAGKEPARPVEAGVRTLGFMGIAGDLQIRVSLKEQYKKIASSFDAATHGKLDPEIWVLRGLLEVDGSVSFEQMPIYQIDGFPDDASSCSGAANCTPLFVNMTLQDDSVVVKELAVHTGGVFEDFDGLVQFNISPVVNAVEVPSQGIKSIRIEDSLGNVLSSTVVSANSPDLDIVSMIVRKKIAMLKINSSDVDGGSLFASVFVEDASGNASPVEVDRPVSGIADFEFNTKFLDHGDYKIVVLLTDGFNTANETAPFVI